jgi:hypothetical protein
MPNEVTVTLGKKKNRYSTHNLGYGDGSVVNVDMSNEVLGLKSLREGVQKNAGLLDADHAVRKIAGTQRLAFCCLVNGRDTIGLFFHL